jgi:hypothetical protein
MRLGELSMTLEQAILDAVRALPADKQKAILDHAKHLREQSPEPKRPRKNGRGLWADFNIDLTAEDIDEARREMWKHFPRDDF